jgi:membrane fusion protein (multidrug efflux system)
MKGIVAASLLAAAMAVAAAGCGQSKAAQPASAPQLAQSPPVSTPAEKFLMVSGPLVVENQVDVAAQREGIVATISAEPGTHVKVGQVLAVLDDRQITADLEAARAKTRSIEADLKNWEAEAKVLEADFQRAQKMWDAGLITKEQYEHAKYKAESDQWDVKRVEQMLVNAKQSQRSLELEAEKTSVRAPFTGIVARRYVRAGQKVALGDRLFWVTAEAPLRIRFTLPESFLRRTQTGQVLPLESSAVDGKYNARIIQVSPVVDPSSGTIDVLAELTGATGGLRPGMTASVAVPTSQ